MTTNSNRKPTFHQWAVVLAGGSGTRLSTLTHRFGSAPKQYWSLDGGPSLLRYAIARGRRITGAARTAVVVANEHAEHWQRPLADVPWHNVVVQPRNCGTAVGILLPLLKILKTDRHAHVAVLPADHHIDDEHALDAPLAEAFSNPDDTVTLLGITPDHADRELGYIVPCERDLSGAQRVAFFVEKPAPDAARALIGRGALWNSFILVARAATLVELIASRFPEPVALMRATAEAGDSQHAWTTLYEQLPSIDLSQDVLSFVVDRLRVVPVADCGWSDLGTPQRVAACLDRAAADNRIVPSSFLSLREAYRQHACALSNPTPLGEPT